jgi:hypothetical protein
MKLDQPAHKVPQVLMEAQVLPAQLVPMAQMAVLDQLAHKVPQVLMEAQVLPAQQVPMELTAV